MKKRLLLGLGLPLSIVPMALVACGSSEVQLRSEYKVVENIDKENVIYDFEYTYENATSVGKLGSLIGTELFQQGSENEIKVDSKGKNVSKSNTYYKLGMTKAVHVTKNDGTVVVYDSDVRETKGELVDENWQKLVSTASNSINNPQFLKDISNAKKLQMTLKDDVYWVDKDGKKTKYKVTTNDYYAHLKSIMFKINPSLRHSKGGYEASDTAADAKWTTRDGDNKSMFSKESTFYDNFYILPLFGISSDKLFEKNTFVTKTASGNEDALTLEALDSEKGASFDNLFKKIIIGTTYFMALPSEYTMENKSKNVSGATGEVADFGYYWYGGKWEEMLFAGPYLPKTISKESELWVQNEFYYNQEWVKDSKSVKRVFYEYKKLDSKTFTNNLFQEFQNKATDNLDFTELDQAQQTEVLKNAEAFNLNYWNVPIKDQLPKVVLWNSFPTWQVASKLTTTRDYNDVYSMLMWGKKVSELEGDNVNLSEHYYVGNGLRFRSLLSNAFNLWAFSQTLDTNSLPWRTSAAPGNAPGGSNQDSSSVVKMLDGTDQLNTTYFFNKNLEKTGSKTWKDDQKQYSDNKADSTKAYQSSQYATVKAEFKALLDEFYQANPSMANQKVEFNFSPRNEVSKQKELDNMNSLLNILNSLDERMDVKLLPSHQNDWDKLRNLTSVGRVFRWGYDYDGIGTWFDALFHVSQGRATEMKMLLEMAALDSEHKLAKALPNLYKMAKAFKEDPNLYPEGSPSFEERRKATTKQMAEDPIKFLKGTSQNFDPIIATSQFFFKYEKTQTNENLLLLVQEIESVLGFHPATLQGTVNNPAKPTPYLTSHHFIKPESPERKVLSFVYYKQRDQVK